MKILILSAYILLVPMAAAAAGNDIFSGNQSEQSQSQSQSQPQSGMSKALPAWSLDKFLPCNAGKDLAMEQYAYSNVTISWSGPVKNGKAHGRGKMTRYADGKVENVYDGYYVDGIREGQGRITYADGTIINASFSGGKMTGDVSLSKPTGEKYNGNMVNYRYYGKGTYYFPTGDKYEGVFRNGQFYTGKYTFNNGGVKYYQRGTEVEKITDKESGYNPKLNEEVTEYFDGDWNRTTRKNAEYYRLITYSAPNIPKGPVRDYYKSGVLQNSFGALFIDYDYTSINVYEGENKVYSKDGDLLSSSYFYNHVLHGPFVEYYENGSMKTRTAYNLGKYNGLYESWYDDESPKFFAEYKDGIIEDGHFTEFDRNGLRAEGFFEQFVSEKNSWAYSNEGVHASASYNSLMFNVSNPDKTYTRVSKMFAADAKSYSAEANIRKDYARPGQGYGLCFDYVDASNCSMFLIGSDKRFTIISYKKGNREVWIDWKSSSAIKDINEVNNLKFFYISNQVVFQINGIEVARINFTPLSKSAGFSVYGAGQHFVKDFITKDYTLR